MSEMRIMDADAGDLKVIWDKDQPDEIKAAREQFDKLIKKGFMAYTVKKDGTSGTMIDKFDEKAEKIILSPQMKGG